MKTKIFRKNLNRELRQKRNRARIIGTAEKPRLSVFRSNKYTYAQLIDDAKGHTMAAASSREVAKNSQKKTVTAKAIGELLAQKAKKLGVKVAIFNRAQYKYHGRVKAVAEGAREAGLKL
ncbi:MAG: 50S ribosomal protein L18 [Parcubacteria group bacterium GW2011_GWA2_47_8b]|uniref:Large ribosomal subunit protein uL18 n=2 Tax=Parcubacteria group TaxID=1794811 RepID=A0A1G1ZKA0_9BACT|nr:MAG: 50S ribosomal protein L18 [Parcubacteria group bacterium GW2011_GWA2_47_8b]OGY65043.1 MAG: 50S ribosomal protein L18 [Candidatus Harrisonbacteria bacterium RIFCSPHIGHO2_12_FULL_48_16]